MSGKKELLIEGYKPDELPEALGPDLEAEVLNGRVIVAKAGSAEILMALEIHGKTLRAELAHVDGGGEGVLPAIMAVIRRLAGRRRVTRIEWLVFATNCARPNPRLRPILERRGFVVKEIPGRGYCYFRQDRVEASARFGVAANEVVDS